MNTILSSQIDSFTYGEPQTHKNLKLIPILSANTSTFDFLTLHEAMEQSLVVITEVSESGSVPTLKLKYSGIIPLLLLEGEEVIGAKQNRILNTSILVKPGVEMEIPVSCTESGRWSYRSREFRASQNFATPTMRKNKVDSVSNNVKSLKMFIGDQRRVWNDIAELCNKADFHSSTSAFSDMMESRKNVTEDFNQHFTCLDGQNGMIALIDGKVIAYEFISNPKVFTQVFNRLVKSYSVEAEFARNQGENENAMEFVQRLKCCEEEVYESLGLGHDHRLKSKDLTGSALVYDDSVIHMAFFSR